MFNFALQRAAAAFVGMAFAGVMCAQDPTTTSTVETQTSSPLEVVAEFNGPMPTGVTVSPDGRIFVNFPRWGDKVDFTVAEVKNGKAIAYPNQEINTTPTQEKLKEGFVSVQSVVVDPAGKVLWALDTGSIQFGPTTYGGPKLVAMDLQQSKVVKTIIFPTDVALANSYLNDVRFDLRRGKEGIAYITDSGVGGIIVVDLASGKSWRRLSNHPATRAEKNFTAIVEGKPLMRQLGPNDPPQPIRIASDGIAISSDGKRLYWCALSSRKLYSIETDLLADQKKPEEDLSMAIREEPERRGASDGLESDAAGNLYLTDYENNSVVLRSGTSGDQELVRDDLLLWPDTLSVAHDGYLYIMANQLHRQPSFQAGKDMRKRPYQLFKVRVDATPIRLVK